MAKALKIAGVIVVGGALLATGVGAVAGLAAGFGAAAGAGAALGFTGLSLSTFLAIGAGLSLGGSLLSPKPKVPSVSSAATDRLNASLVLRAPRTFVFGRTAMATDVRDQEYSADQAYLHRFIVVASHKVQAIEELWLDDKQAWTSAGGVTSAFTGYLTVTAVLEGSAANAINISARMGTTRRYTGCAYLYVKFRLTGINSKANSPFASSVPSRTTIIGKGAWLYDPRLDSTAGGSGTQRANDQTTWAWDDNACRNPVLQTLTFLLGWRIQNPVTSAYKLAVGKGIPPARIDLASFITAANICDEAVSKAAGGTEPRYRSDGIFSESDDLSTVLDNFKAAMNAVLDDVDGKIRVTVLSNDLASPIGSLTTGDVLGAFTWTQTPPLSDSFNVVRGGYTDPSTTSLYQLVDYPEVSITSPDGIERVSTVNLPLVQSPSQAQRLAKTRLQRALYGGTFQAVFTSVAWKFQKGDCIQFTFGPLGWANKLFRIVDMTVQVDGTVPMMLREENAAIYAWSATDAPAVVGALPTVYDPTLAPVVQALADKNATFNQATAPTADESVEDDTWQDTGNGNLEYKRLAGTGRLAIGGNRIVIGGVAIVVRPWALANDARIDASATKLATVETGADITPPRVTGSTAATVNYDYLGAAKAGELPRDLLFKAATAAGTDVTTGSAWSAALKAGSVTFTIGAATGVLNVTALGVDGGTVELTASYAGKTGKASIALIRNPDPPPVSTGGGGGGGGGTVGNTDSTSAIASTASATHAVVTRLLTVKVGASGSVALSFPGSFKRTTTGTNGAFGKWQRSPSGAGTWTDVASETASTVSADRVVGGAEPYSNPGSLTVNPTASSLTVGSNYDFRLLLRSDTSDLDTVNWTGSATATSS